MSRLFHVSDLHFGRADMVALDWFANTVRDERPDAVLITGDLTMRARRREFAAAADWLGKLGVPLTIEVGNHDLPYFNLWARFVTPYARYEGLERVLEKPVALPDASVVPLRTTARAQWRVNWAHGLVTRNRIAETVAALDAVPSGRVRIVTCHHPLFDKPGGEAEGRTRGGAEALAALADHGADLILSGHVHDPFDLMWTGGTRPVRMVGAGTLSERVRATRPGYNRITIADGRIDVVAEAMA